MKVMMYDNIETFLMENEAALLEKESVNQLLLANAYMTRTVDSLDDIFFGKVEHELGGCELIFFSMAPYNLLVQMMKKQVDDHAVEALVDYLIRHDLKIRGINANHQICQTFINRYESQTNKTFDLHLAMDIMELTQINDVVLPKGCFKVATVEDLDWLTVWNMAFIKEATHEEVSYETAYNKLKGRIENQVVYLYENEFGIPVSIAAVPRKLVNGVSISFVYTDVCQRGKGYGLAVVHQLSQLCLAKGNHFCTLYVDKTNPISNRVYQKIGYQIIEDNYDYRLQIKG